MNSHNDNNLQCENDMMNQKKCTGAILLKQSNRFTDSALSRGAESSDVLHVLSQSSPKSHSKLNNTINSKLSRPMPQLQLSNLK